MKKIIIGLIAILSFAQAFSQGGNDPALYTNYRFTYGNQLARYWADTVLQIPQDTIWSKDGLAMKAGVLYVGNHTRWAPVGSGSSADSAVFLTVYRADTARINWYNSLALKASQSALHDTAAAIRADFPSGSAGTDSSDAIDWGLRKRVVSKVRYYSPDSAKLTTKAQLQATIDSLNNLLGKKQDTSAKFNLYVLRDGQPGDSLLHGSDSTLHTPAQRDSSTSTVHHTVNPNGSWTWYGTADALKRNIADTTNQTGVPLMGRMYKSAIDSMKGVNDARYLQTQTQADYTQATTSDPSYIQHKPTLGTAAAKDVPASGDASSTQIVMGNDSRLGGSSGTDTSTSVSGGLSISRVLNNVNISGDSLLKKKKIDLGRLPVITQTYAVQGLSATGTTVTNYPIANLDSNNFAFTTANYFSLGGTKYGGVLWNLPVGDSMLVRAPFCVLIGSSYSEGHTALGSRLQGNLGNGLLGTYVYNYPDSVGQLSYSFRKLTNMRWYNHGIGGYTSSQTRNNWPRDVLAQSGNTDGRVAATLSGNKPYMVFYDGCGNDPYIAGMTTQISIDNLKYFAASCQQYGIKLIVCNSPAGGAATVAGYNYLATVNKFLESGGLDQYGAVVYDLKRFFSDSTWGYDGIHMKASYNAGDGVHFSKVGYDSLANDVFRTVHMPVLAKMIISNRIAPSSPISNFNYVSAFTMDGVAYTSTKATDTIALTNPLGANPNLVYDPGDSIWIRATATTNVVGSSTVYGYGHIDFVLDNNPNSDDYYTRRTMGSNGAVTPRMDVNQIIFHTENITSLAQPFIDGYGSGAAGSNHAFQFIPNALGGGSAIFNGLANTTAYQNAIVSAYGSAQNGFATNGGVYAAGNLNTLGNLQLGIVGAPTAIGYGIGVYGGSMNFEGLGSTLATGDIFKFKCFSTLTPTVNSPNKLYSIIRTNTGWGQSSTTGADTVAIFGGTYPFNNTALGVTQKSYYGGVFLRADPQALGFSQLYALWLVNGHNWFNTGGESAGVTAIGSNVPAGSARLDVKSTTRGFMPPRMTTGQRDSIGYISSVTVSSAGSYSVVPTVTITGGTGAGATLNATIPGGLLNISLIEGGYAYKTSSAVTVSITGGTGSGGVATATIHGADSGLIIFNTTIDSLQYFNGTGWISLGGGSGGGSPYASLQKYSLNLGSTYDARSFVDQGYDDSARAAAIAAALINTVITGSITSQHDLGSGAAPTTGTLGVGVTSLTVSGTDKYMTLTLVTSGAVSGTLGIVTYNAAWPSNPITVISPADATTAGAITGTTNGFAIINGTSTTTATMAGTILLAGTYHFNVYSGAN